jgi:hypothetical protein
MTSRFEVLDELAAALGGEVSGGRVLAPGPNHSAADRSLSVWPIKNRAGFSVHSFSGDDRLACIQHVKALLDPEKRAALAKLGAELPTQSTPALDEQRRRNIALARDSWDRAIPPLRTPVERYFWVSRHLDLPTDIAGAVIRFDPKCVWTDDLTGKKFQTLAMIAAMRSIATDEVVAVHRTRLTPLGERLDRRFLGAAAGAAVKLDAHETVGDALVIGEGIETCLTARQLGIRPVWALGSSGGIKSFPVLPHVETLTILAERCEASAAAIAVCGARWRASGRNVMINRPTLGKDLNDAWRGIA